MVVEPLKKFAVGDMPPSPTTSNPISSNPNTHKKPTRHHYKRRSSGRAHATKLAPMAKAHTQQQSTAEGDDDNNNDEDDNFEDVDQQKQRHQQHAPRKPMKRTHSNKSIHCLSSIDPHRKVNLSGFTMTSKSTVTSSSSQNTSHQSPPLTPTDQQFQQEQQQNSSTETEKTVYVPNRDNTTAPLMEYSTRKTKNMTMPSFQVSHQVTAAPIANTLNATANTLVVPDNSALSNLTTPNNTTISIVTASATSHDKDKTVSRAKLLCSRFVRHADDLTTTTHHFDLTFAEVDKEYKYIKTYQDPMVESLTRCMKQRQQRQKTNMNRHPTQSSQSQLQRLAQRGAQQRTLSSSILPTMSTLASLSSSPSLAESALPAFSPHHHQQQQQHMECRQMARRRHQRLQAAHTSSTHHHSSSTPSSTEINKQSVNRWSAGALLDRVFYGAS